MYAPSRSSADRFAQRICLLWGCLIGSAFGLGGCAKMIAKPIGQAMNEPVQTVRARDYNRVLASWTRNVKVYRKLEASFFASSTLHSPHFRSAFAVTFPDIYGQGGQITRQELVTLEDGIERYFNFFLAIYTPNAKDNDLHKEDSIWGLTLSSDTGSKVKPVEIVRIKIDSNIRAVYQYIGSFDRAYIVRFPMVDEEGKPLLTERTQYLKLEIVSALHRGHMIWGQRPRKRAKK